MKRSVLAALATAVAVPVFGLSLRYRRDMSAARARLAAVKRHAISTKWGAVEYAERGCGDPVLVLHGIFHNCVGGLLSVRELFPDRRIVAPSRLKYLGSSMPPNASPAAQADALAALLDALDIDQIDVVGVSAGTTAALQLALRHPGKLKHLVLLVGNLPGSPTAVVQPTWATLVNRQFPLWALRTFAPSTMARLAGVPAAFAMTAEDARFVAEFIDSLFPVRPEGPTFDAFVSNADVETYTLEAISVPTLIVHTKDDPLASHEASRRAAERIPGARFVSLESGGHLMLGQATTIRVELADFLTENGDRSADRVASQAPRHERGIGLPPQRRVVSRASMSKTHFGKSPRRPPYKGVATESVYVPMRDGARIAVDVMRPKSAPADVKLPTILLIARYWRSFALRGFALPNRAPIGPRQPLPDFLVPHGYAIVAMDTRGSGASTGSTPYPFSDCEIEDYREVVDWIIRQPWSDSQVGATGISYEGIAAELLTVAHPATRAVIPQQADLDQYAEFLFPGGIPNEWMITTWQHTNEALDRNRFPAEWTSSQGGSLLGRAAASLSRFAIKGVRPVDADTGGSQLRQAVTDHEANADVAAWSRAVTYRDDPFGPSGITVDAMSTLRHRDRIERSGAAVFAWGSWLDGSTADGVIRRFASYTNPQSGVIGAWSHGYLNHGSPYGEPRARLRPDIKALWQEMLEYFDYYLKGAGDPTMGEKKLFYYTLGEEAWKVTGVWPPPGAATERWYFAGASTLSRDAPTHDEGADSYTIDFQATTGLSNRWRTQDGVTRVFYGDRAEADRRLLTYTSAPLTEDVEITGHSVVTLYVASTATDGAFYIYLEEVNENGQVTYVTEGQLRALHRRVTDRRPPLTLFVPHHSFLRQDGMPLIQGEVAELRFGLLPTSCRVRRGHRLRVAIAGHDKDTFARIPDGGVPTIAVQRNSRYASRIDLAIVRT